jgi:CspA family cold shock protein
MSELQSDHRYTGQVKFFNRERGFGFITRLDNLVDYFVHYQDIKPTTQCWNVLFEGEYVEFILREGPNGEQAGDVTGIERRSLMCEHNQLGRSQNGRRGPKKANSDQTSSTSDQAN